jgi:hypothetical protein
MMWRLNRWYLQHKELGELEDGTIDPHVGMPALKVVPVHIEGVN